MTAATGKRIPLDPEPVADGNIFVSHIDHGMPVVHVVLHHDQVPRGEPFTYQSHFVSCPDRDTWRKP